MSFIRRFKKRGKVYLAEVESVRVNGKVKQKFIRYVGKEADGKTILSCSISDALVNSVKVSGPLMVLHAIATKLGLPELLGTYANEILAMLYAHCLDYKSLNYLKTWFGRTDLNLILDLEDLTEKRLVNALDSIEKLDLQQFQSFVFERLKAAYAIETSGIVYDVTNTYFRGNKCSLAQFGHDKEKRKGYPLIQIGLAVTQEHGIPIFHKTFRGNIHDSRTFLDLSTQIDQLGISQGVAVTDRGISSEMNTEFLSKKGWEIICGLKLDQKIKSHIRERTHLKQESTIKNRIKLNESIFYCTKERFKHGKTPGWLVVIYNKRRAQEQQESRYDEIEAARIRLKQGKNIKPDLMKFFGKDARLLEWKLKKASEFDGFSTIFTTANLPVNQLIKSYFDKDVIEKVFKSLKGVVRLRPVRHWLYNRVEAHVFICYLSCLILSILKNCVKGLEMSFQGALDELDGLYRVYLTDPKRGTKLSKLVSLTIKQEKILRAIDKSLLAKCSE